MFGKFLTNISKPQALDSNDLLASIKEVETNRIKVDTDQQYDNLIEQSKKIVLKYCNTKNAHDLADAMELLIEATEIKKNRADAYFYLTSISCAIEDFDMALKYLKITTLIDPNFPRLDNLRERITNSLNIGGVA